MAEKTKTPRATLEKKKSAPAKKAVKKTAEPAARKPRRAAVKQAVPTPVVEAAVETPRRRPVFQAGTWISILMLAALVGLAFYLNREKENTAADATPTLGTTFLFTDADGIVSSIEVKPAEGESVKIARNAENAWAVILPTEAEANQGLAESAATQITALPINSQIEDGKSPEIFGLKDPAYVITVEFKDGKTRTLEVGDVTPTNSGYYVRVDQDRMYITDLSGIEALLQLGVFPPYLNTPVPTVEAVVTPTP